MIDENRRIRQENLFAEVAQMYYIQDLTQAEIAARLCLSRTRVSRILTKARQLGVVEIKINYTSRRCFELEDIIKRKFQIKDVYICNSHNYSYQSALDQIGELAARYLDDSLKPNQTVGITWGRAVSHTIQNMKPNANLKPNIIQVIGATAVENAIIDVPGIIRKMIAKTNGRGYYLNAPLYVEDDYVRESLIKQPIIEKTLNSAKKADIIITGIGDITEDTMEYMWTGYDNRELLESLSEKNAVGFICAQAYDINGKPVDSDFNKRIIGVSLQELAKVDTVLGIAGGKRKAKALLGALRAGFINVLVTDSVCANELLLLDEM